MLELGRYRRPNVPRTEKICDSEVEDEIHFILRCPALVNARRPILGECVKHMEKFYFLLNTCNVNLLAKTCNISDVSVKIIIVNVSHGEITILSPNTLLFALS